VILKQFGYTFTALCVCSLDIVPNCVQTWNFEVWATGSEKGDEFRIRNDVRRAITFCYPFCKVGTDIDLCKFKENTFRVLLTASLGLCGYNGKT